jgi:RHS repeat-associated protein
LAAGFQYDSAGDVTYDTSKGNSYLYDGEGRICAVKSEPSPGTYTMTAYVYDAEGNRVAKGVISSWPTNGLCPNIATAGVFTPTNSYVLGPSNEQLTETGSDGQGNMVWSHTNVFAAGSLIGTYDKDGLHFYLNDWLGNRRVQTDYAGVFEQSCTNLPFGDSLNCTASLVSPTEHHFTGKERDVESGNDYMFARYYNSATGRFLSPDWSAKEEPVPYAKLDNPQSLNLYSYVYNNPLRTADPDGHESDADKDKKLPAPDAQHDHTITVRQVEGQGANFAGHATVQIDGGKEIGYGPKQDMTAKQLAENKSVPGQVEPRAAGVKTEDQVTIHVTGDQAKAAQDTIDAVAKNPGNYQLVGNNCANFAERVVNSAGGNAPPDVKPGALINDMRKQQYKDNSVQTPTPQ